MALWAVYELEDPMDGGILSPVNGMTRGQNKKDKTNLLPMAASLPFNPREASCAKENLGKGLAVLLV